MQPGLCRPSKGETLQCTGPGCDQLRKLAFWYFCLFLFSFHPPEYHCEEYHGGLEHLWQRVEEVREEHGVECVHPSPRIGLVGCEIILSDESEIMNMTETDPSEFCVRSIHDDQ